MDRDSKASDTQRLVYRDQANLWIGVPLLALGLFLVSGSLFSIIMHWLNSEPIFGKHGFPSLLFGYVLDFVVLTLGVRGCTERQLVFDREYYRITKTKKVFFWKQSEVYDIRNFDTVSWRSESKSDGEHRRVRYPITLSGRNVLVDLFEDVSKAQAVRTVAEIEEFLQLEQKHDDDVYEPARGEINVSAGTAVLMVRGFMFLWYLFCGVFVVAGLAFAGTAGWEVVQGKMEVGEGLAFVGGSLLFTLLAVVFFAIGRKTFPAQMESMKSEAARERASRAASKATTLQEPPREESGGLAGRAGPSTAGGSNGSAPAAGWKHLKWLVIIPGLMLGCETQVATTLEGEEVSIRNRLIFPWNDHPSATDLAREFDHEKFAKIGVSRTYAFGVYSSSSSASVPGAKSKRNRGQPNLAEQAQRDHELSGRWREQTAQLKAWIKQIGGKAQTAHTWHMGTKDVEVDFEVDLSQSQIRDEDLEQLALRESQAELYIGSRLIRSGFIQTLNLSGRQITDAGLSQLKDLKNLRVLFLNDSQTTDGGLAHLEDVTQMRALYLERSKITDAGLVSLTKLSKLAYLSLSGTQISDVGIEHLRKLTTLRKLEIAECQLTAKGVVELRQALPKCEVIDQ